MLVPLDPEQVRANLVALAAKYNTSLAALSRLIGRNEAYLQQFVKRGTPARLDEADRSSSAVTSAGLGRGTRGRRKRPDLRHGGVNGNLGA